ncbi:MAG: phenylalanine--tRNA ligase subunit alpha [Lactobacillales bacterium]|jgi:phenylalanyl-tRNA synthetase alpha chain|nr:phenylalanine--tRNA ligase subunit alpha [Lactobacillales bacterium]
MQTQIAQMKPELIASVEKADTLVALDEIRVQALGKNGRITNLMKEMGKLSPEDKKNVGQLLNVFKTEIADALEKRKEFLSEKEMNERLNSESVDVTLPPRPETHMGRIHPVSQVMEEMLTIFAQMGFDLADGPDIEDDWHNFEALNIAPSHPARQMQATFFMDGTADKVLRTHTSGVQIRTMENKKPPIKIVAPGRTYRRDYDMTHTPMFHQIEGLVIDTETNLAHLKGVLMEFMKLFFETNDVALRFRPSYFPFTEPSYEADVGSARENGEFKIKSGAGWTELLGCGMVHPNVLKNCGLDPNVYQGFAFGCGVDRFAMLKYGIPDLRSFFEADMRWIKHYGFLPLDIPTITGGLSLNGGHKR